MTERERQEQIVSLESELEYLEKLYTERMKEVDAPRFTTRRFRGLNRQQARHRAARVGDRIIEIREQIDALKAGAKAEAA